GDIGLAADDRGERVHWATVEGGRSPIEVVPRGQAIVVATQLGVPDGQFDAAIVDVAPPATAKVALQPHATYKLTGVVVDPSGNEVAAFCSIELRIGLFLSLGVGPTGHFARELPAGFDGTLKCAIAAAQVTLPLPANRTPGSTVELRVQLRWSDRATAARASSMGRRRRTRRPSARSAPSRPSSRCVVRST